MVLKEDEGNVVETGQKWGSEVVDGFESQQQEFNVNSVFDQKPEELLENRYDVVEWGRSL